MIKDDKKVDMVSHPSHYTSGSIEVIDMMESIWDKKYLIVYCEITAFKYRMRAGHKGDIVEDIQKAQWYEQKAKDLKNALKKEEKE